MSFNENSFFLKKLLVDQTNDAVLVILIDASLSELFVVIDSGVYRTNENEIFLDRYFYETIFYI